MQEHYNDYMLRRTKEENMKENMKNTNKTILTDCDGVLLDWETSFHNWMADNGYKTIVENVYEMEVAYGIAKSECKRLVREFNNSAWMCCLPALRDSRSGVAKLVEAGYTFICITCNVFQQGITCQRVQFSIRVQYFYEQKKKH